MRAVARLEIDRYVDTLEPVLGDQVLGIITSAMYDNPLSVYREYIQNSADALAGARLLDRGAVEVSVDPARRCIEIRDDGPGLSEEMAVRTLVPIATSRKQRPADRGFRGIGRLCGLAFAESVTFLTRASGGRHVTRIKWSGSELRAHIDKTGHTAQAVRECVEIERMAGNEFPEHFFWVNVDGVHRHAAGILLNRDTVRAYIGEVCPVPIATSFPFSTDVGRLFGDSERPIAVRVSLTEDADQIYRPLGRELRLSKHRVDHFRDFEEIRVSSLDRATVAAVGWIAHSSYLGALPKSLDIRGVRARSGNIQIGGEGVFDHLFDQDRFNRWCVGEIHVTDSRVVPNGRRDYFEASPHLRNLENHLAVLFRGITARCRVASQRRNGVRRFEAAVGDIERWYRLVSSGWLARDDALVVAARVREQAIRLSEKAGTLEQWNEDAAMRLRTVAGDLREFDGPNQEPLGTMAEAEQRAYYGAFRALVEVTDSPGVALEAIETVADKMGLGKNARKKAG